MKLTHKTWLFVLMITLLALTLACRAGLPREEGALRDPERDAARSEVHVVTEDFSFSIDASRVKAGLVTFFVENNGSMPHDFSIEVDGEEHKTPLIDPGESVTLEVELEPGTYSYVCTVPGHAMLGMRGSLTVIAE